MRFQKEPVRPDGHCPDVGRAATRNQLVSGPRNVRPTGHDPCHPLAMITRKSTWERLYLGAALPKEEAPPAAGLVNSPAWAPVGTKAGAAYGRGGRQCPPRAVCRAPCSPRDRHADPMHHCTAGSARRARPTRPGQKQAPQSVSRANRQVTRAPSSRCCERLSPTPGRVRAARCAADSTSSPWLVS
jgi:hypothetical protein